MIWALTSAHFCISVSLSFCINFMHWFILSSKKPFSSRTLKHFIYLILVYDRDYIYIHIYMYVYVSKKREKKSEWKMRLWESFLWMSLWKTTSTYNAPTLKFKSLRTSCFCIPDPHGSFSRCFVCSKCSFWSCWRTLSCLWKTCACSWTFLQGWIKVCCCHVQAEVRTQMQESGGQK